MDRFLSADYGGGSAGGSEGVETQIASTLTPKCKTYASFSSTEHEGGAAAVGEGGAIHSSRECLILNTKIFSSTEHGGGGGGERPIALFQGGTTPDSPGQRCVLQLQISRPDPESTSSRIRHSYAGFRQTQA